MKKILFVCLGNICRSPMAEGAFLRLLEKKANTDVIVDSAGTGAYHVGEPADKRMRGVAEERGVILPSLARQVADEDFYSFDLIVAMDQNNMIDLKRRYPSDGTARLILFRDYDEEGRGLDVPDPYYGGIEGFNEVFDICTRTSETLYEKECITNSN